MICEGVGGVGGGASPPHQYGAVLGFGHQKEMTPHSLHMMMTVSTANHTNIFAN